MGGRSRYLASGVGTYQRVVEAGCALLRNGGVGALSMRELARAAGVTVGGVQTHFPTRDELVRSVLRAWGREITHALEEAVRTDRGLARTWKLCETWACLPGAARIAIEAVGRDAVGPDAGGVPEVALGHLRRWLSLTRRSLRQAQLMKQLLPGVDIRSVAFEVHQLLWSECWASPLFGVDASTGHILGAAHARLCGIAANPGAALPPRSSISEKPFGEEPIDDVSDDPCPPLWRQVLHPWDPLYQAFERHAIMGDPRNFLWAPEVTEDDVAAARAFTPAPPVP